MIDPRIQAISESKAKEAAQQADAIYTQEHEKKSESGTNRKMAHITQVVTQNSLI
jgi:hypothetical protein